MAFLSIDIGGTTYPVGRISGRAAMSTLFRFEVALTSTNAVPSPTDLLGQDATLTFEDPYAQQLVVHGIAASVHTTAGALTAGGGGLDLVIEPAAAALGVGRDHRLFQEMNVVDVVKKVISTASFSGPVRWSTSGSYPKRPYWVQHGESDWAFIERIIAEHGIYYWFDHASGSTTLVFGDDSTTATAIEGDGSMPFHDDAGLGAKRDGVIRVASEMRVATDKVTLNDYNFDKPRLDLKSSFGDGPREVYDFPGRFGVPGDGKALAQARLEALRARRHLLTGETGSARLRAGLSFELTDHPVEKLNQKLLVTSMRWEAAGQRGGSSSEALSIRWTAIPLTTPFRPEVRPAARPAGGPQTGVVVGAPGEEIHPDDKGRIRVQHYWDRLGKRDDKAATWVRVGQFPLGGSMIIPRIGWDVLVHHHEGDIEQPVVVTHLYDGLHPVPYPLPANKTRTSWQTATTPGGGSVNEIRFEDKAGSEEVFVNASKDMNVVVGDKKNETIGVNSTETIGSNLDVKVGSNLKYDIKSNQSKTVGASETLTVSGSRNVNIGGSETATIGGSRSVTAIKGSSIDATGGRTATIGGSLMAASGLGVSRMVLGSLSVTVGGAWISAAATGLANMTAGASAETVGGAKIGAGAAGCATSVKGAAAITVGGAYVIAAGGKGGETATGALAVTVGGALLANAPTIEIEADSEISVMVGGSSLTINSSSIEIKAPTILSPGGVIDKAGSKIEHN